MCDSTIQFLLDDYADHEDRRDRCETPFVDYQNEESNMAYENYSQREALRERDEQPTVQEQRILDEASDKAYEEYVMRKELAERQSMMDLAKFAEDVNACADVESLEAFEDYSNREEERARNDILFKRSPTVFDEYAEREELRTRSE
jgi:hypothetical protein